MENKLLISRGQGGEGWVGGPEKDMRRDLCGDRTILSLDVNTLVFYWTKFRKTFLLG